jgi:hypothetical protein
MSRNLKKCSAWNGVMVMCLRRWLQGASCDLVSRCHTPEVALGQSFVRAHGRESCLYWDLHAHVLCVSPSANCADRGADRKAGGRPLSLVTALPGIGPARVGLRLLISAT